MARAKASVLISRPCNQSIQLMQHQHMQQTEDPRGDGSVRGGGREGGGGLVAALVLMRRRREKSSERQ